MAECFEMARQSTGAQLGDDPRMLAPASKRQIVTRMVRNLRGVYFMRHAYGKALQTLNLLLSADPDDAEEYKQRGLVHTEMRSFAAARADLENYLPEIYRLRQQTGKKSTSTCGRYASIRQG